jgi:hypothetical protein
MPALGRAGAWPTSAVKIMTTVALVRLRYKLTVHGRDGADNALAHCQPTGDRRADRRDAVTGVYN